MTFGKTFWASFLASVVVIILFSLFFFLVFVGGFIANLSSMGESDVTVKNKSILKIELNGQIVENYKGDDFNFNLDKVLPGGMDVKKIGLYQLTRAIRNAKEDDRIKAIYLNLKPLQGGWASLKSVREELVAFKEETDKPIYAYGEIYSESMYYLASVADSVFVYPTGIVEFNGFAYTPMYWKGMFDKLEIQPKVFKGPNNKYKSAVEPYIREEMSAENRVQVDAFLGSMWDVFAEEVAASRNMSKNQIDKIADNFVFGYGQDAVELGLVDATMYEDEVFDLLKEAAGKEDKEKLDFISLTKYAKVPAKSEKTHENKIAIIFAQGGIQSGSNQDDVIGSETTAKALRKAREDDDVKAIVFRVNSPGGSALASDVIAREVELIAGNEEKGIDRTKPIIASMGDVAASGGYYISARCDKIYAQPNTITGSIGIFGVLFNTKELFNKKLGITFDEVETHEHANFANPNYTMDAKEDSLFNQFVEDGYEDFLKVVLSGRDGFGNERSAIDSVARGRVWSGQDAKNIKLVDEFGDLDDALAEAARMASLEEDQYEIVTYPKTKSPIEEIFGDLAGGAKTYVESQQPLHEEMKMLYQLKKRMPKSGVYMLMPYEIEIE